MSDKTSEPGIDRDAQPTAEQTSLTAGDLATLNAAFDRLQESTERLTAAISGSADDYARLADRLERGH